MSTLFDVDQSCTCGNVYCRSCNPPDAKRLRASDWRTSEMGAQRVAYRATSQKAKLLAAFSEAFPRDLTDEEAAELAGVSLASEYAKRCGELRADGVIKVVEPLPGVALTRPGRSGVPRICSVFVE